MTNIEHSDASLKLFTEIFFNQREHLQKHNPYDLDRLKYTCIREGDLEQLERSISISYEGNEGILAKDPLRSAKNLAIVIITVACRSALEGGLHYEVAFTLSDSSINTVEDTTTPEAAMLVAKETQFEYCRLVNELKKYKQNAKYTKPNVLVSKCKDYIFLHLHNKIRVQEMATALYVNPNYLSNVFKEHEGITIMHFIMNEKIKLTKNMLIYSPYSFIEITTYLGFSSQSHLGTQFKRHTGMTLREFRELYQLSKQ
ncbi:MAG: AraC family transcriptional regulator [Eubacteriales bacterium]